MGKTRAKFIDDSKPTAKTKDDNKKSSRSKDELVEKLKEELGIEEKKLDVGSEKIDKEIRGSKLENQISNIQPQRPASKIQPLTSKSKPRSKKYQEAAKDLDKSKFYPLAEAVDMVKKMSYSKFNGTLEVHINTSQTGLRGLVSLPYASGKKLSILAFGNGAEKSGADFVGNENVIEELTKGPSTGSGLNFDLLITTPEWMPKLARAARILGPRGLMPNPKNGTIVSGENGLKKAVEGFQAGKTEFKTEPKAPIIHLAGGKLSQPNEELIANVKALTAVIGKTRIKKVTLAPTMGPSVKVNPASF